MWRGLYEQMQQVGPRCAGLASWQVGESQPLAQVSFAMGRLWRWWGEKKFRGNCMKVVYCRGNDSARPYGARKHDSEAFPGLRCAPPWAIFLPSLRDGWCGSKISSKVLLSCAALHAGLFSCHPYGTAGAVARSAPRFPQLCCAPRWAIFLPSLRDGWCGSKISSKVPPVALRSTLGYFPAIPTGRLVR
jgi:hypothetical protein